MNITPQNFTSISLAFLIIFSASCSSNPNASALKSADLPAIVADPEAISLSLIQLIATPERYDGKKIRIQGFANIEFEGDSLFLNRESCLRHIHKDGLWLHIPGWVEKNQSLFHHRYVLLEGKFIADDHGHMSMWNGAVSDITRFQVFE
jgi:hypothetical protein